jgi:dihydroneopterin aldolase
LPSNPDRLSIVGLEVWSRVGCTAAERAFPQRLEVDVDLFLPLRRAGETDDLAATVDYAAVAARVKAVLESGERRLAETLAERAAALVLKEFRVPAVRVNVRKRALPGIAHAEVSVLRGRPQGKI